MRHLKGALTDDPQIISQDKLVLVSLYSDLLCFLCSNEFTSPSSIHFNPMVHLSCSDNCFTSNRSFSLQLKSSKTDPLQMGCSIMVLCSTAMHQLPGSLASRQFQSPSFLLNREISTQGQSNLNFAPPAPMLGFHHRALCASHSFHMVGSNYCRRR